MKVTKAELPQRLEEVEDRFVDLWDTMSSLWGISPTMARIHGLLYITGAARSMDDIMARLAISRGNVSMNVSKLVEWGLVHRVHGHRGPEDGERGDAVPVLREEGGALLQLLEIRAPVAGVLCRGRDHTIQRSHTDKSGLRVHSQDGLPRMGEAVLAASDGQEAQDPRRGRERRDRSAGGGLDLGDRAT